MTQCGMSGTCVSNKTHCCSSTVTERTITNNGCFYGITINKHIVQDVVVTEFYEELATLIVTTLLQRFLLSTAMALKYEPTCVSATNLLVKKGGR